MPSNGIARAHASTRETSAPLDSRVINEAGRGARYSGWEGREANWIWLAPVAGRACALVIGDLAPPYRRGLSAHFDRIEHLTIESLQHAMRESSGRNPASPHSTLAFDDRSVDCVISTDLIKQWPSPTGRPYRDAGFLATLAELRRLLRDDGLLYLSGPNALCPKRLLAGENGHALHMSATRKALARVGFSDIRAYFAETSDDNVSTLIPASRQAALWYERRERLPRPRLPLRALWAAGGMYELLYPDAFVLATK
jgi:SAM-dependent methyltransferase